MLQKNSFLGKRIASVLLVILLAAGFWGFAPIAAKAAPTKPTLVVKNGGDSGDDSLRDVIASAEDGDTIIFAPGLTTVTLTSGEISFSKSLTIDGGGIVTIERDAVTAFRLLHCSADTLTLRGLALEGGNASGDGGAVHVASGNAVFDFCVFRDNYSGADGGATRVSGTATLTNCDFIGNTAAGYGGALRVGGAATLNGCRFTGNTAYITGAAELNGAATVTDCIFTDNAITYSTGRAGGLNITGAGTLNRCLFNGNRAAFGGGAYISGLATVTDCVFLNNTGSVSGGLYTYDDTELLNCAFSGNTGMSAMYTAGGNVTAVNTTFFDNRHPGAAGGDAVLVVSQVSGKGGDANLIHCTFTDNKKGYFDKYNIAVSGTIYAQNCLITLDGMTDYTKSGTDLGGENAFDLSYANCFGNNSLTYNYLMLLPEGLPSLATVLSGYETDAAGSDRGTAGGVCQFGACNLSARSWVVTTSAGSGTGSLYQRASEAAAYSTAPLPDRCVIYFAATDSVSGTSKFHIEAGNISLADDMMIIGRLGADGLSEISLDARMLGNTRGFSASGTETTYYYGLHILDTRAPDGGNGGGINSSGSVVAQSCVFSGNIARVNGGAIYAAGNATLRDCDFATRNSAYTNGGAVYVGGNAKISGCRFVENGGSYGGALYLSDAGTHVLRNCYFENNTGYCGGAVSIANGTVTAIDCAFVGNSVNGYSGTIRGGALYANTANLRGCYFAGNKIDGNAGNILRGGGMHAINATLTDCHFTGNTAPSSTNSGGAAVSIVNTATLTDCSFVGNAASSSGNRFGGALFLDTSSSSVLNSCTFEGNTAGTYGGAIYSSASVTLNGCTLKNNTAGSEGGGVYANTVTLNGCTLIGNSTGGNGGGLRVSVGNAMVNASAFIDNKAPGGSGAAIYAPGAPTLVLTNCTVSGNTGATSTGGTIDCGTRTYIFHSTITDNTGAGSFIDSGKFIYPYNSIIMGNVGGQVNGPGNFMGFDNFIEGLSTLPGSSPAVYIMRRHVFGLNMLSGTIHPILGNGIAAGTNTAISAFTVNSISYLDAGQRAAVVSALQKDQTGAMRATSGAVSYGAVELGQNALLTVEVTTQPDKTSYLVTDTTIDLTGTLLKFTYTNGVEEDIPYDLPSIDNDKAAVEATLGTAGGKEVSFTFLGVTSATGKGAQLNVEKIDTTTTLVSSGSPSLYSKSVSFTATVAAASGTPAGRIQFYADGVLRREITLDAAGQTTWSVDYLSGGTHTIVAKYLGNDTYNESESAPLDHTVDKANSKIHFLYQANTINPTVYGQAAIFLTSVNGDIPGNTSNPAPTGTVDYYDGATLLGTKNVNEIALSSFSTTSLAVGSHDITAVYSGSNNYNPSTTEVHVQIVLKADTSVNVTSVAPTSSAYGDEVAITAQLAVIAPGADELAGKTIAFMLDGVLLGTAVCDEFGVATLQSTAFPVGGHLITAVFEGDANLNPGESEAWPYNTNKGAQSTPAFADAEITVTYGDAPFPLPDVTGGESSGAYIYRSSDESIVTVDPDTGVVTIIAAGEVTVYVKKDGDGNYNASAEGSIRITVAKAPLTVTVNDAGKTYGEPDPVFGYTVNASQLKYSDTAEDAIYGTPVYNYFGTNADAYPLSVTGLQSDNYALTFVPGTMTIAKRAITVTANDQMKYVDAEDPALTWTVQPPLLTGDTLRGSLQYSGTEPGEYDIVEKEAFANPNYTITFVKGTMTILEHAATGEGGYTLLLWPTLAGSLLGLGLVLVGKKRRRLD